MKKKLIAAHSLLLSVFLAFGSPFSQVYAAETETDDTQTESNTANPNNYDDEWSNIEALNEGEPIINMFDENDYMIFLGNKYTDSIITNEDEALASLDNIRNLIGLDGINLTYYRTDISPITENVYYTFFQTSKGEINGQEVNTRYYSSLVKVITDKDGAVLGVSSDLTHDESLEYSGGNFISKEDAENYVAARLGTGHRVYPEVTELVYWNDEGTASYVSETKVVPAYTVFADADTTDQNNTSGKPYAVYVVSAEYTEDEENPIHCMEVFYTDSINSDAFQDVYTSTFFFDGMEDVGNYTYTVNLNWVKESFSDYAGDMTMEITVPVMQDTATGLYYLGSKEKLITCTNEYDFDYYETLNAYVTENPDDVNSWHFYQRGLEEENIIQYFNDPNYVLSAFSVFYDVTNDFENRYGLPSVDSTDIPLLLGVYAVSDNTYPEKITDFVYNAYNFGQIRDWAVMCVSPALAECLNPVVMGHEYTHGINSQLTKTQYLNSPGALMESYADIIGAQMAMLNERIEPEEYWNIAGKYADQMRNMANPLEFHQPKYPHGIYYIPPIDSTLGNNLDYGGVHQNSGICNYLAYCLVNGIDEVENPALFTMAENIDMWFETLYMATYMTDFYDEGQYLEFAAKCMCIPEEKQQYLLTLLRMFGMEYKEDRTVSVDIPEDYREVTFTVEALDENNNDLYDFGFNLWDENADYLCAAGDTQPGESITFKVKTDDTYSPDVSIGYRKNCNILSTLNLTNTMADEYHIYLETAVCETNIEYTISSDDFDYLNTDFSDTYNEHLQDNGDGTYTFSSEEPGLFYITLSNEDDGNCKIIELDVSEAE